MFNELRLRFEVPACGFGERDKRGICHGPQTTSGLSDSHVNLNREHYIDFQSLATEETQHGIKYGTKLILT